MSPRRQFDVMLTAAEAYPRLEREFLTAEREVIACFRIFDPETTLRSEAARQHGETWADLIRHTLERGVKVRLSVTDFDPVIRLDDHRYAWRCHDGFRAAGDASGRGDNLEVRVLMHPARVGLLPRLMLWPRLVQEVSSQLNEINQDDRVSARQLIDTVPGLRALAIRRGNALRARKGVPHLVPVTHHQKLAVFDGARLYIGGLDVNDRRFDTPQHRRGTAETWHDVQVLVDGPVVDEARQHLLNMEDAFDGKPVPKTKRLLRTISAKRRMALPFLSPRPVVSEIAAAHLDAIARAERLIYLESQYFRDPIIAEALAKRAHEVPDLSLIMMLPAAPEDIAFTDDWGSDAGYGEHMQVKALDVLLGAFGRRAFVGTPVQPRALDSDGRDAHLGAALVYLHAKVSLFDDRFGIVSSANLNGRSLNWDTEAGVGTEHPEEAAALKQRCFSHWLGAEAGEEFYNFDTACAAWTGRARDNAAKPPAARVGFVVPYHIEPAEEAAQILPGVPAEMV